MALVTGHRADRCLPSADQIHAARPAFERRSWRELWVEPDHARSLLGQSAASSSRPIRRRRTRSSRSSAAASAGATRSTARASGEWSAKFPPEAPTEVVASRILWAVGYHQPPIYYLGQVDWRRRRRRRIRSCRRAFARRDPAINGRVRIERQGQLVVLPKSVRRHAPAEGAARAAGDARQLRPEGRQQRALRAERDRSRAHASGTSPRDLGHTFGRTGVLDAPRGDVEVFEKTPFISGMVNGRVQFDWRGRHDALFDDITPADVRWICERLAAPDRQAVAGRASAPAGTRRVDADRFIRRLKQKIAEGLALKG